MDTELVRAQERAVPIEDLCAGLAYAVARNYLEKVVAGRRIGEHIMFQGGTASNAAVVAAFRSLLGRPVQVHPYNRISGAIGAALLAARVEPGRTRFLGLDSCVGSSARSFECQRCENRCQVNRVQVGQRVVHFGDVCERYSEGDREDIISSRPFPELFAAREQLVESYVSPPPGETADRPRIGLLRASLNLELLPLWAGLLRELGYAPVISGRTTSRLLQSHSRGVPAEVCLPVRCAAAHVRALLAEGNVDRVFVPALLECPPRCKGDQSHTCFYVQQLPDMLRIDLKEHVVSAQFALTNGVLGLVEPVLALAEALGRSPEAVLRALTRARALYSSYVAERMRMGKQALTAPFDRAVVVLGRPYNVHDTFLNLFLARQLDKLGLPAIPADLLPLEEIHLDPRWDTIPWHYSREQLRTIELIRRDGRLFPILVSSYGCGPDGFTIKHVEELLSRRPRLLLEFDEHRGEAGLVTRLEAFADEIEDFVRNRGRGREVSPRSSTPGPNELPSGKRFFVPNFSEHAGVYAAVLRSAGFEAEVLPPPGEDTIRLGEAYTTGRECHPYAVLAGELIQFLRSSYVRNKDIFLFPNCTTPCLLRQYGDGFRMLLERQQLSKVEIYEATLDQLGQIVGLHGLLRLYEGLLATDILLVLANRLHPYEKQAGAVDRILAQSLGWIALAVENRQQLDALLLHTSASLWNVPRTGDPGSRPVVGVTGDLYTRINPLGNASLFRRLEQLGCEVWPSPSFAKMADLSYTLDVQRNFERGSFGAAAVGGLSSAAMARVRRRLVRHLSADVSRLAVEPPVEELIQLARPYVGPRTNYLIVLSAAKIVDFLRRGAAGVVNAAGINCAVGITTASVVPAIRAEFGQAPVMTIFYGGNEGPAQRIRLETFVHQVHERQCPAVA